MGAFISQVDSLPDSSALMNDFGVAFGGVIFFWLLGLCIGVLVNSIR